MKRQPTILIVADESAMSQTLGTLLATDDYHLAFAKSGTEAFEKATQLTPDLILLDVLMPDIDGFEVCRRFRADPLLAAVPVILVTPLDDRKARLKGIEAGADELISTPIDRTELQARVRTITRLNRYHHLLMERAKIERAKQEWEVTADSLPQVVCLLDENARLLRANRTVEAWHLGCVFDVKGQEIHDLFHPDCPQQACELKTFFGQAWNQLAQGKAAQWETDDRILNRYLHFHVRPVSAHTRQKVGAASFAVVVAHDITARKQAEAALQNAHDTLERRVAQRTAELEQANTRLIEQMRLLALSADVGTALTRGHLLAEMLDACAQALIRHVPVEVVGIWTDNPEERMLELIASAGRDTNLHAAYRRIPINMGRIGRIASQRQPYQTDAVLDDEETLEKEWVKQEGLVAFAGYPLIVEDQFVGVVALFARKPLSFATAKALESVGDEIALGIQRRLTTDVLLRTDDVLEKVMGGITAAAQTETINWEALDQHLLSLTGEDGAAEESDELAGTDLTDSR